MSDTEGIAAEARLEAREEPGRQQLTIDELTLLPDSDSDSGSGGDSPEEADAAGGAAGGAADEVCCADWVPHADRPRPPPR